MRPFLPGVVLEAAALAVLPAVAGADHEVEEGRPSGLDQAREVNLSAAGG